MFFFFLPRRRKFALTRNNERRDEEIPFSFPFSSPPLTPILVLKVDTIEDTSRTLLSIRRTDFGRTAASLLIFGGMRALITPVSHARFRQIGVMSHLTKKKQIRRTITEITGRAARERHEKKTEAISACTVSAALSASDTSGRPRRGIETAADSELTPIRQE